MKSLPRLIKNIKMQIETLQEERSKHIDQEQQCVHQQQQLLEEINAQLTTIDADILPFYAPYIQRTTHQKTIIIQQISQIRLMIEQKNQAIQNLFIQRKQYEILLEQQQKRHQQEQAAKDFKQENEYASYIYSKNQKK